MHFFLYLYHIYICICISLYERMTACKTHVNPHCMEDRNNFLECITLFQTNFAFRALQFYAEPTSIEFLNIFKNTWRNFSNFLQKFDVIFGTFRELSHSSKLHLKRLKWFWDFLIILKEGASSYYQKVGEIKRPLFWIGLG